jgi:hypothetical protein
LYLDEDVNVLIADLLRARRFDVITWSFDKKIFYAIYSVYQGNSSTTDSVFSQIVKTPMIRMG